MAEAELRRRAAVAIAGPDARTLLHNVLTLDMDGVDAHGSGYGALLTPQGKVLWDFILHRRPDGYAADLRAEEAEAFARRLKLYRLRSKVDIALAPDLAVRVAWPDLQGDRPADPRLPALGSRWLDDRQGTPPEPVALAAEEAWDRHRIAQTIPEGGVDFAFGNSFPHDIAMDSLHGVAFAKGCYIGQEVVSRMRHRGTARRRVVAAAGTDLPEPGAEITAGGRIVGQLGSSAEGRGIAVVRLDRVRDARERGEPIEAGERAVDLTLPAWASYDWPAETAAD